MSDSCNIKEYHLNKISENDLNINIIPSADDILIIEAKDCKSYRKVMSRKDDYIYPKRNFDRYIKDCKRIFIYINFKLETNEIISKRVFVSNIHGEVYHGLSDEGEFIRSVNISDISFPKLDNLSLKSSLENLPDLDALKFICEYGLINFFNEYIIKDSINSKSSLSEALYVATKHKQYEIAKKLIEDDRLVSKKYHSRHMYVAIRYGTAEILNLLIDHPDKIDPTFEDNDLLRHAVLHHEIESLNLLLKNDKIVSKLTAKWINDNITDSEYNQAYIDELHRALEL